MMLMSIALILLLGLLMGWVSSQWKLPSLLGMILVGILLGPHTLDVLDESLLAISANLRQVALVIILTRAGLALNLNDLRRVGRPAILMCFIPACVEMLGTILFAPLFLNVSVLEAAIMGSVIAAVSPAVVVPRMLYLMDSGYGVSKSIPQLILAGASVDDVFVLVIFSALLSLTSSGTLSVGSLTQIPIAIGLGIAVGGVVGWGIISCFKRLRMNDLVRVLILLSISFILLELEHYLADVVPISGLLAIMSMGIVMRQVDEALASRLSTIYRQLWIPAEIFLFVLVGATVNLTYAWSAGVGAILVTVLALLFRMVGVFLSLIKTDLSAKERLFCMLAYTPKATVQAAIGAIPLSMGLSCGNIVLTVAVLAILMTAPFGAICIDRLHMHLLAKG